MADVETENLTTEPGQPPELEKVHSQPATKEGTAPEVNRGGENPSSKTVGGLLGKLFKRNGRHPENCDCPIHRKTDGSSRFSPPAVPFPDAPKKLDVAFAPPVVPVNPARFQVWGRLVKRGFKTLYNLFTAETPSKVKRVVNLEGMTAEEGKTLLESLPITEDEFTDLENSATRLAEKYNLTTGYDEEIEFVITAGGIIARLVKVNRTLDKVLARLEAKTS